MYLYISFYVSIYLSFFLSIYLSEQTSKQTCPPPYIQILRCEGGAKSFSFFRGLFVVPFDANKNEITVETVAKKGNE